MTQSNESCTMRTADRSRTRFPFLMVTAMAAVAAGGAWNVAAAIEPVPHAATAEEDQSGGVASRTAPLAWNKVAVEIDSGLRQLPDNAEDRLHILFS